MSRRVSAQFAKAEGRAREGPGASGAIGSTHTGAGRAQRGAVLIGAGSLLVIMHAASSVVVPAEPATKPHAVPAQVLTLHPGLCGLSDPGVPRLTETPPDADVVGRDSLGMEPAEPCRWIVSPGRDFEFSVRGKACEGTDRAVLTLWDWENQPVRQTSFPMPFAGSVSCRVEGRGTWVLTLDGMRGDACAMRLVRSFSVCPDNNARRSAWKSSGFWVGQCCFPGAHHVTVKGRTVRPPGLTADQSRDLDAELVARMGVQVARINPVVRRRDAEGMDLDFSLADQCVNAYVSRGLSLNVQLFWAYGAGRGPVLDPYRNAAGAAILPWKERPYRHFVRETVRRYARHAAFIQIGNEPDNEQQYAGTAEEYADQLRQAADEIRRAAPGVRITNGGYCFDNDATRRIIAAVPGLTDFVSYHWHGPLGGLKEFWSRIDQVHREAGYVGLKYANTEMGYVMPTVGSERAGAVHIMQKLLYCWAHGHEGVLLYSSREPGWPRQHETEYGFVDHFYCPRFVYGASAAFLDRYAGFSFRRTLAEDDNRHVYEFGLDRQRMVAAFAVNSPVRITLKSDAGSATLLDVMGNETLFPVPSRVTVQAGEYPRSVRFVGATRVELCDG